MKKRKYSAKEIIGIVLLISLILSVIYSFVQFLIAPEEAINGEIYVKVKSDYLLMLVQCILGLLVMCLPTFVTHKFRVIVPNTISILYYIFLYCAIFLGEVFDFYYSIPHWDTMLHAFSGAMLGALGFVLVDFLNRDRAISGVSLSPLFVSLFSFSFALAVGALWEVYEFSFDAILGLNMQKHSTGEGLALMGREALSDTMKDIIIDAIAAMIISILGFVLNKRKQKSNKKSDAE